MHYSNALSVWTDATRIITHHNAHCLTSVDRPLDYYINYIKLYIIISKIKTIVCGLNNRERILSFKTTTGFL